MRFLPLLLLMGCASQLPYDYPEYPNPKPCYVEGSYQKSCYAGELAVGSILIRGQYRLICCAKDSQ